MQTSTLLYRLADLPTDEPMAGVTRRRILGQKVMISQVHLARGTLVPSHAHENEQFAIVTAGRVRFELGVRGAQDFRVLEVSRGEVLHLPPLLPHGAEALEDSLVLDVFSPPSETTGVDQVPEA